MEKRASGLDRESREGALHQYRKLRVAFLNFDRALRALSSGSARPGAIASAPKSIADCLAAREASEAA